MGVLRWSYLGSVDYPAALELQLRLREAIGRGEVADTLLLLEHPAVVTLGRSAKPEHVVAPEHVLAQRGIQRVEIGRGGDVTYHGPGQLVGYPLRQIGRAIRQHVSGITDALIALLGRYGIEGWPRDDAPGVWTAAGKVAALGIDARQRVAMHGFALNVSTRLSDYQLIVPCGLHEPVTSMAALGVSPTPSVEDVARELAPLLARAYGAELQELPREALVA